MQRLFLKLIGFSLLGFIICSCNPTTLTYTIIYSEEEPIGDITKALEKVLERHYNVDIVLINNAGARSMANLDNVASGKVDFTITENHVPFHGEVDSVFRQVNLGCCIPADRLAVDT